MIAPRRMALQSAIDRTLRCDRRAGARDPARARPLTSASARQRPARPGLPRNAIFLSCLRRLLCLLSARRAGEAFAACRIPWPGHGGSRYARCWPIRCAGPPWSPGQRAARTPPRGPAGAVLAAAGHPWGRSRRRGHAAPLTGRGGGPPSRPSAGVRRRRACGLRDGQRTRARTSSRMAVMASWLGASTLRRSRGSVLEGRRLNQRPSPRLTVSPSSRSVVTPGRA